jgi:hypothetical protein
MVFGVAELYREPLHRKYYASRFSCAYLFFLIRSVERGRRGGALD